MLRRWLARGGAGAPPTSEDVNARHFDAQAEDYDARFGLSLDLARARASHIREHAPGTRPLAGLQVLELGCGTGNLAAALVLEGIAERCVGVDISAGMIEVAREKTREVPGCEFLAHSATDLPFPDGSFDLVVGDAFLHHIVDAGACLSEVRRLLRPGGLATFNEPSRDGYAFLELLLRTVVTASGRSDEVLDDYLRFLAFMREHEGDLAALEAYPLPDKHVFSEARLRGLADEAGFACLRVVPSTSRLSDLWEGSLRLLMRGLQPGEPIRPDLLATARLADEVLSEAAWRHLSLHNQIYFHDCVAD
jgi:ubiquinone/menaquinone biosynthesis C-methylase UbiE